MAQRTVRSPLAMAIGLAVLVLPPSPAGAAAGWWDRVAEEIRDSEYAISWQTTTKIPGVPSAWQAPNRAHGFRIYFLDDGFRVVPREEDAPAWEWGLALAGIGRAELEIDAAPARLYPRGNRVDYDRGTIVEWYVNGPRGLEQGFTLDAPPGGTVPEGAAASLHLTLALSGGLRPIVSADGRAVDFATPRGRRVVRYASLAAHDARGRDLPARMEGFSGAGRRGLRLVIDDRGASYPVTIDPLATSPSWSAESDQAGAKLGFAVAGAGDVNGDGFSDVVVGAPLFDAGQADEGRAFVFLGSPSGLQAAAAWTAEGNQANAQFGFAVATAGDVDGDGYSDVVIGAPLFDNGQTDEGRIFVYRGSAAGLSAAASWTAEADQAGAQIGFAVGSAGDANGDGYSDLVAGAPYYDDGETDEGIVRVWHGSASGLSPTPAITLERNQAGAEFGYAVAGGGDVNGDGYSDVFAGSPRYDYTVADQGAVWFYPGSAGGLIDSPRGLLSTQAGSLWGTSVAIVGDVNGDGYADAVVGAPLFDEPEVDEGIARLLYGDPGGPLMGPIDWQCDQAGAQFGASVAAAGDVNGDGYADVIIGAPKFDGGQTDEGKVFLIYGIIPGVVQWSVEGNQAGAQLGGAVALAGDVDGDGYSDVLIGSALWDGGQTDEGKAVVYQGSPDGLIDPTWSTEIDQAGAQLGYAIASAGDVNGDAYSDVIVGAPYYDGGQTDEGKVFVYLGSAAGLVTPAAWSVESNQASSNFGAAVSSAGDVNGDGYDDVIVGSRTYDAGQTDEGRTFVYLGSPTGLGTTAAWTAESNQASANFGTSVASAGDVNGDGYADVIVGARTYDNGQTDEGRAFVYLGSSAGLAASAGWTAEANQASADFGVSVAGAGDVNGDGYSDVIVGADKYDNGQTDEGRAFVYLGSPTGLAATAAWTAEGNQTGVAPAPAFGFSVASAGDVNGDGYSDVIVGAPYYDNGADNEGVAFLYLGSAAGLAATASWTAEGEQAAAHLGYTVGCAGDVNGDGYADVFAGAPHYDGGVPAHVDSGMAIVSYGSAAGPAAAYSSFFVWSDQANAHFGWAVASAGDVNGDGYADLVVGVPGYDAGQTDEGRFYGYPGGGWFHGTGARPQQRRADDAAPVARLGSSGDPGAFRIAAHAGSVFGRGRVKLEWEAKPVAVTFDGTGTGTGAAWTDSGTAGVALDEAVSGLDVDRVYHWRARLRFSPVDLPVQGTGRWIAVPWNGWQEGDLRTVCTASAPSGVATVSAGRSAGVTLIAWTAIPEAATYDVVAGGLSLLRNSSGDFTAATARCLAGGTTGTSATDAAVPGTGDGFWYLVRATNCAGASTYDDGSASQQGLRDAEIAASPNACP